MASSNEYRSVAGPLVRVAAATLVLLAGCSKRHTLPSVELSENCVQISESFAANPGWEGKGNRTAPQNFGHSFTKNAGTAAGELGGAIVREPAAYYAADVGELDPVTDTLHMTGSGKLLDGIGNFRLGWFDKDGNLSAPNLIGIFADTSELYVQTGNARGELLKSIGFNKAFTFEVVYNPHDNDGNGSVTYVIDGGQPNVIPLSEAAKRDLGKLDRFGMLSLGAGGDHTLGAFVDDVTYTSRKRQTPPPK